MQGQLVTKVNLKAKPEFVERLKKVLTDLIEPSWKEPGCLAYKMLRSAEDPQRFLLYMTWQDEEAFQRHTQRPWVQEFDQNQAGSLLDKPYVVGRWWMLA